MAWMTSGADGIEGKPAFREAFQRRRCMVPG
jgi:putative SOS response-associated peptidase YedK